MLLHNVIDDAMDVFEGRKNADRFFNDPEAWADYMLGIKLWSKQAEVARAVVTDKSVVVKASHGCGKSFLAAILICWWVDTRYPKAFVASTAPSQKQISAIVWRYVRQLKNLADQRYKDRLTDHTFPGYITSDNEWKEDGGVILGFGRKPPDNKEDDSFQGIHDAYVLAIGDEAVGLSPAMIDALGNITSNEQSRRVLICNPTNPASYVGKIYKENYPNWTKFTISCFDSPNFTGGEGLDKDALEKLVGPSYVEEKKLEYGEDSARYKARVLGEFAWDTGASLIMPEDAAIGFDTDIVPDVDTEIILGVDIARFGEDDSVIYMNHGGVLRYVDKSPSAKMRVTATANWVHKHAIDAGAHEVRVDGAGIGGAVVDEILSFEPRYRVVEMNPSATTPDRKQWHNARSYWWDKFRRALREGQIDLDNADERLVDELLMVEYKFNDATGGLVMQSKEDMKKKGRKSPDFADAAVMACAPLYEVPQAVHGKIYADPSAYTMADFQLDLPNYIRAWTETW